MAGECTADHIDEILYLIYIGAELLLSIILTLSFHTQFVPRHSVRMSLAFIISAIAVVIVANFRDLWLSGTSFVCLSLTISGIFWVQFARFTLAQPVEV